MKEDENPPTLTASPGEKLSESFKQVPSAAALEKFGGELEDDNKRQAEAHAGIDLWATHKSIIGRKRSCAEMEPVADGVLVFTSPPPEDGGVEAVSLESGQSKIMVPTGVAESIRSREEVTWGVVVKVGPGMPLWRDSVGNCTGVSGRAPMDVRVGDEVLYATKLGRFVPAKEGFFRSLWSRELLLTIPGTAETKALADTLRGGA